MGILSGVVSYIFGLALNLLDAAIDGFLGVLGFDLGTFETYFPAASQFNEVITGFAIGLLFMMLIFQIFRNFGIMLDMESEDPLKMVGKAALFFGMIVHSRSIVDFIIRLLVDPYSIFLNTVSGPFEFRLMTLVTSMFTSVFANPFMAVLALILLFLLGWQFLKLIIECVERYIVFCFILYFAPIVFATGAFKSTEQIFKSWCRMLASQSLLLLINIWSIQLFLSFLPVFESGASSIIFNFLIGYAFLLFAQKADTLLRMLGLNTASTGDMMRSFGGTIAGLAFTIKTMSGAAGRVVSGVGRMFGGAGSAGAATVGAGKAAAGGTVAGMAAGTGAGAAAGGIFGLAGANSSVAGGGSSPGPGGSATDSGISAAKQRFTNDVLNSVWSQMSGNRDNSDSQPQAFRFEEGADGLHDTGQGNPAIGGMRSIDAETREGLGNLAHGLAHDNFNPASRTFSGGGFGEFTGKDANVIGASQLTPASGFEQHSVKMRDGSVGTIYKNADTGQAHLVQFGSVDNGLVQGTINEVNGDTGRMGDSMAFKAVHGSVPGAESFSAHSVPVSDGAGGVYHVSTGADTSFFAPGSEPPQPSTLRSERQSVPQDRSGGTTGQPTMSSGHTGHSTVSSHDTSTIPSSSISGDKFGGGSSRGAGSSRSSRPGRFTASGEFGGWGGGGSTPSGSVEGGREGFGRDTQSPPINTDMKQPPDEARRFSRNNPANMEIFSRETDGSQSFDRSPASPDTMPSMGSDDK